jgi:hypothetical protein
VILEITLYWGGREILLKYRLTLNVFSELGEILCKVEIF